MNWYNVVHEGERGPTHSV